MTPMHQLCDDSLECNCPEKREEHRNNFKKRAQRAEYMKNYMREVRRKKKETT